MYHLDYTVMYGAYIRRRLRDNADPVYCLTIRFVQNQLEELTFEENENNCFVRIPTVFCFTGFETTSAQVIEEMRTRIPRQIGCHVFMVRNTLQFCRTYANRQGQNMLYDCANTGSVHSIYPVLRETVVQQYRLCLGLMFRIHQDYGTRDFDSMPTPTHMNTKGVENITEQIFDINYYNQMMASLSKSCFAIYVCGGARLIVEDERGFASGLPGVKVQSSRVKSYFQQGSLVIFEGRVWLNLCCPTDRNQSLNMNLYDAIQPNVTLFPERTRKSIHHWFIQRKQKKFVIFIGYHESSYDTSCWKLSTKENREVANLDIPDGGYILGIEPWKRGFQEIHARHRYERLYEGVVYPVPITPGLEFAVPRDEDMINRILGSGEYRRGGRYQRDFTVQLNAYVPNEFRYNPGLGSVVERSVLRHDLRKEPLVPPLRPPIYNALDNSYHYLSHLTDIQFISAQQMYKIDGHYYHLRKEEMNEYEWKYPMEWNKYVNQYPNRFNGLEMRVGIDLRVYLKYKNPEQNQYEIIGNIESYYFKKN